MTWDSSPSSVTQELILLTISSCKFSSDISHLLKFHIYSFFQALRVRLFITIINLIYLPGGASGKKHACQCIKDTVLPLGWEDSLEKGMATNSFSCLENSMDRGTWVATVHGVAKSQTWLSDWAQTTDLNV